MTDVPKKRTAAALGFLVLVLMIISLALKVFLNDVSPWSIVALDFQGLAVVIMSMLLVRTVRGQRDEYWRERANRPMSPDEAEDD